MIQTGHQLLPLCTKDLRSEQKVAVFVWSDLPKGVKIYKKIAQEEDFSLAIG